MFNPLYQRHRYLDDTLHLTIERLALYHWHWHLWWFERNVKQPCVIESNFGYSVGTGYADGGTTGRCHKRVEESRGEPIRSSFGSRCSTRFHLFPHITTSTRPFGKIFYSSKQLRKFLEYRYTRGTSGQSSKFESMIEMDLKEFLFLFRYIREMNEKFVLIEKNKSILYKNSVI